MRLRETWAWDVMQWHPRYELEMQEQTQVCGAEEQVWWEEGGVSGKQLPVLSFELE